MWNSFPYDSWLLSDGKTVNDQLTDFWTWGGANSTGTYILTVLGIVVMCVALIWFVVLEKQKLEAQAEALRSAGAFRGPDPGPPSAV